MTVPVVSARQAADRDASAIQAGTPSIDLMRRAGFGAANVLRARFAQLAPKGVVVFVGAGNNGGDGWVVAGTLVREGIPVRVVEVVPSRSADAQLARDSALPLLASSASFGEPAIVVDALLGTGASGPLRSPIAEAVAQLHDLRSKGVKIVALDLPTGVDASNGNVAAGGVVADLTVSFGTVKRGQLVARANCGEIVVIDIGLGGHAHLRDGAPNLLDAARFHASVPSFGADAHKGTRKKLLVVGGAYGMAGAAALAARAALRSGIGMVRLCVAHESVVPLQSGVLEATTTPWPTDDA
ncbi:MAG: NAD(P)H-hydrate epimerase, partial [Gemmatimonadaceae bacterium]